MVVVTAVVGVAVVGAQLCRWWWRWWRCGGGSDSGGSCGVRVGGGSDGGGCGDKVAVSVVVTAFIRVAVVIVVGEQ